jgi:deoxyxylulose-5-phosphate synthase
MRECCAHNESVGVVIDEAVVEVKNGELHHGTIGVLFKSTRSQLSIIHPSRPTALLREHHRPQAMTPRRMN